MFPYSCSCHKKIMNNKRGPKWVEQDWKQQNCVPSNQCASYEMNINHGPHKTQVKEKKCTMKKAILFNFYRFLNLIIWLLPDYLFYPISRTRIQSYIYVFFQRHAQNDTLKHISVLYCQRRWLELELTQTQTRKQHACKIHRQHYIKGAWTDQWNIRDQRI